MSGSVPSSSNVVLGTSHEDFKEIVQKLEELTKSLATKKDIPYILSQWRLQWSSIRSSWKDLEPKIVPKQLKQKIGIGNCWAIAYYRQWYALTKLHGIKKPQRVLTIDILNDGVSPRFKGQSGGHSGGVRHLQAAADFLKREGYASDIRIHYKKDSESEEDYEEFIIKHLLTKGPATIGIQVFPNFLTSGGRGTLTPTPEERKIVPYEKITGFHAALLMGHGYDSDGKEVWEYYESLGKHWGYLGFGLLARHEGLILSATEMTL